MHGLLTGHLQYQILILLSDLETRTMTTREKAPRSPKRKNIASSPGSNISPQPQSPPISDHFVIKCEVSEDDDGEHVGLQKDAIVTSDEMEIDEKTSSKKSSPTQTRAKESTSPQRPTRKSSRMAEMKMKGKLSAKDSQVPVDQLEEYEKLSCIYTAFKLHTSCE